MEGRDRERYREIQTDRQSKRVEVYRRQYGVDDGWLNLSTNLSTVPRQKPGKIEILSQQLRIAYAIIFQPPCRPLDLIPYTVGGAIDECDAIHIFFINRGLPSLSYVTNASVSLR